MIRGDRQVAAVGRHTAQIKGTSTKLQETVLSGALFYYNSRNSEEVCENVYKVS